MKRLSLFIVCLFSVFSMMMAQDRISVFIGNANRYASVDLSGFRQRMCREYRMSPRDLDDCYRMCGRDWGRVGIILELAHTSGRRYKDVCSYYKRYGNRGWNHVLVELGIRPGSRYHVNFYDRIDYHGDCWHDCYDSYYRDRRHHKYYKDRHYKYHKRHRYYDDDDDDDDDDDFFDD